MGRYANLTEVMSPIGPDLEAVAIDEADRCPAGHQHIAVVYVRDQVAMLVDQGEGPSHVDGGVQQKLPRGVREASDTALGAVQIMDLSIPRSLGHDKAEARPAE